MPPVRPEHARGPLRGARAAVFALAALLLATTAHLAGGGRLPSLPALALLVVPLAWGAVALTGRRRGRVATVAALGVAELGLHEAFMALAGPACPGAAAMAGPHGMPGMPGMGAAFAVCAPEPMAGMSGMSAHAGMVPAAMLAAHALATIATALVLAYGERLLAALPGLLAARLTRWVTAVVVPALPRVPRRTATRARTRLDEVVAGSMLRRGPPALRRVAAPA